MSGNDHSRINTLLGHSLNSDLVPLYLVHHFEMTLQGFGRLKYNLEKL